MKRVSRRFNKFENNKYSSLPIDMYYDLKSIFEDRFCEDGYYDDELEFKENIESMSSGDNDTMVDDAIMWMADDFGWDDDTLEDYREDITIDLAKMAAELIKYDDRWNDEVKESRAYSKFRSNKPRNEYINSKFNRIKIKNESAKMLPDGTTANRVSDVLSSLTGSGWRYPKQAIRKLDSMGILDMSTNRFYPTAEDVADAIEDCWDDLIGNGKGAAEFFIGNFGGKTHCSLTLYPISGGDSSIRKVTLKFDWPDDMA